MAAEGCRVQRQHHRPFQEGRRELRQGVRSSRQRAVDEIDRRRTPAEIAGVLFSSPASNYIVGDIASDIS